METTLNTTVTLTVCGDTFKGRTWLKDNGWQWDADNKTWYLTDCELVEGQMGLGLGYSRNGNWIGTLAAIRSRIECYAKTSRFVLSAE